MKPCIFSGAATAIVTPFTDSGVDYPALKALLKRQLDSGIDAIVVCGTTGEAATMTYEERMETIAFTAETVGGKVPVIAGTGSNNTKAAITLSKDAVSAGVNGILVVTPYYNKATQEGLVAHYSAIGDAVDCPLILYNVPSRTGVSMTADTYRTLAAHPNIVGVKEASGSFALVQETLATCDMNVWSGNDEDTAAICMLGGKGVISVASNVVPQRMTELVSACLQNDFKAAGQMQLSLRKLIKALFMAVNPIPVKTALAMMGQCQEIFRLPLSPLSPAQRDILAEVLREEGLLTQTA